MIEDLFGLAKNLFLLVIGIEMRSCNQLISTYLFRTAASIVQMHLNVFGLDAQARLLWSEFTLNFVCHVTVTADLHIILEFVYVNCVS